MKKARVKRIKKNAVVPTISGPDYKLDQTDYSKNLSWRRWPILILFMLYGMASTFQAIQFVVKPELFSTYYDISINTVRDLKTAVRPFFLEFGLQKHRYI